jgi:hypothetical protein
VLLRVETDDKGRDVDDLLADTDVALADQDTGVVDGLGEAELVDTGLETSLQEIFNLQGQDVIELHAGLVEHTNTNQTANEGISFEETLGVLFVEGKKLTVVEKRELVEVIPVKHRPVGTEGPCLHTGQHDGSWTR